MIKSKLIFSVYITLWALGEIGTIASFLALNPVAILIFGTIWATSIAIAINAE